MSGALDELGVLHQSHPGSHGLWGRSGLLAAPGFAVRDGWTRHACFLNVHPLASTGRQVATAAGLPLPDGTRPWMGSIMAERRGAARMPKVRAALVQHLAAACECDDYHLFTGHPWVAGLRQRAS